MKKFLLPLVMLLGSLAWGQASRVDGQVTGPNGQPVHFPTIRVCQASATAGSNTTFCTPTATIYTDRTAVTNAINPFTGDFNGNYHFYGAAGRVLLEVISNGVVQYDIPDFLIGCEQGVTCGGSATLSGGNTNALTVWTGPSTVGPSNVFDSGGVFSTTDTVDFSGAAALKVPTGAGLASTTLAAITFDTTANRPKIGANGGTNLTLLTTADLGSTIVQTTAGATFGAFTYDYSLSHLGVPKGTTANILARSCGQGEIAFATDATAGQMIYECDANNHWTQQLNSGGGGGSVWSALTNPAANLSLSMNTFTTAYTWANTTTNVPYTLTFGALTGSPNVAQFLVQDTTASTNTGPLFKVAPQGTSTAQGIAVVMPTGSTANGLTVTAGTSTSYAISVPFGGGNIGFNRLVSTTTNAPTSGCSICFGATDAIKYWNGALSQAMILAQGGGAGAVQLGDTPGAAFAGPVTSVTAGGTLVFQPKAATSNGNGGDITIQGGNGAGTGTNGFVHILPGTGGSGNPGFVDIGNSAVSFTGPVNDSVNPVGFFGGLAALTSSGTITAIAAGSSTGVVGVCVSSNCATSSATISLAFEGTVPVLLDNTGVTGDYVTISTSVNGEGHDSGASVPVGTQVIGQVLGVRSGSVYNVLIAGTGGGGTGGSANALVTNPALSQTAQSQSSAAASLIVKCGPGAASNQVCFQIVDNSGNNLFSATQGGTFTWGSGTNGSMTVGSVLAAHYDSSAAAFLPTAGILRLGTGDSICWDNNANNANICLSKNASDALVIPAAAPGTNAILTFATTNPVNFAVTNPSAGRTITFGDPGGADSVAYLAATQTFTNKTIGDSLTMNNAAAGSNPASGFSVLRIDSTTGLLSCLSGGVGTTGAGSSCMPASGGGSAALSSITAAGGANSISNLDNAQTWKWTLTTAAKSAFQFTENAAATNGAGSQFLVNINTLAASTASPFQVTARGLVNGFQSDVVTGNIKLIGSAGLDLNTANSVYKEFPNEGVTGTTAAKLVKLNGSSQNVIITTTSDLGNLEGICVNGCGTSGNAQIATFGFVTAAFDNATTANDCVVASTTAAGSVHDVACTALNGEELLGRVLSTNVGAGSYVMDLYPIQPGLTVGAATNGNTITSTNGLTVTYAGGVTSFDLTQALKTSSSPSFTKVLLSGGNGIQGTTGNASLTFQGGTDGNTSAQGNGTFRGGDITGTSNNAAGNATFRGGNSGSTNSGQSAGQTLIQAGQATAGAAGGPNNGQLLVEGAYVKGATYTVSAVQHFSADNTVQDCPTSCTDFIGVAITSNSNSALVALEGTQVTVLYDATVSPSAGWHACMSTTVAGKVLAQSADCSSHQQIGIIEKAGTNVTSGPITIRMR